MKFEFNTELLNTTYAYPGHNPEAYVTIESCQEMFNALVFQNQMLKIGLVLLIIFFLLYGTYYVLTKNNKN